MAVYNIHGGHNPAERSRVERLIYSMNQRKTEKLPKQLLSI